MVNGIPLSRFFRTFLPLMGWLTFGILVSPHPGWGCLPQPQIEPPSPDWEEIFRLELKGIVLDSEAAPLFTEIGHRLSLSSQMSPATPLPSGTIYIVDWKIKNPIRTIQFQSWSWGWGTTSPSVFENFGAIGTFTFCPQTLTRKILGEPLSLDSQGAEFFEKFAPKLGSSSSILQVQHKHAIGYVQFFRGRGEPGLRLVLSNTHFLDIAIFSVFGELIMVDSLDLGWRIEWRPSSPVVRQLVDFLLFTRLSLVL